MGRRHNDVFLPGEELLRAEPVTPPATKAPARARLVPSATEARQKIDGTRPRWRTAAALAAIGLAVALAAARLITASGGAAVDRPPASSASRIAQVAPALPPAPPASVAPTPKPRPQAGPRPDPARRPRARHGSRSQGEAPPPAAFSPPATEITPSAPSTERFGIER